MKKILAIAAFAVLSMGSLMAQNNFQGVITYKATSTGETAVNLKEESSTAELKVYNDKVLTSNPFFTSNPFIYSMLGFNSALIDGHKMYTCFSVGELLSALAMRDQEVDYDGPTKILTENEITQQEIDSLTIPCTEGYYIEYVNGETQKIADMTAKKAIIHIFDEDGEDHPNEVWYCDEMGPDVNVLFFGIKGVALVFSVNLGEGRQLTFTASEIKRGKVKMNDMLLPSGFETISKENFNNLTEDIFEAIKYLQEE